MYIQDEDWNPDGFICLLSVKNIHLYNARPENDIVGG